MSVKNLYTSNLKTYQNLKIKEVAEINILVGLLDITIYTNGGTFNNISTAFHYSTIGSFVIGSFEFAKSTLTSGVQDSVNYMNVVIHNLPAHIFPRDDCTLGYTEGTIDSTYTKMSLKYIRNTNEFHIELYNLANVPLGNVDIDINSVNCIWFI